METKKRAGSVITTAIDGDAMVFAVTGVGELRLNTLMLNAEVKQRALLHGMKQRIIDSAAIPCDNITGKPATPQQKYEAMRALVEHYNSGTSDWNIARGEGGERAAGGITLKAVAMVQGVDEALMRKRIEGLAERKGLTAKGILASLAKSPDVIRTIAEIRAKAANVDADGLLDEVSA